VWGWCVNEGLSRKGDPAPREVSRVGMSVGLCVVRQYEGPGAGGAVPRSDVVQGDPEQTVGGYSQVTQVVGQGRACGRDQVVCGEAWKGAMVCISESARALIRVAGETARALIHVAPQRRTDCVCGGR
jgi:hypothetical protein